MERLGLIGEGRFSTGCPLGVKLGLWERQPYLTGITPKADIASGHCPTPVEVSALANLISHRPGGNQLPQQLPDTRGPPFFGMVPKNGLYCLFRSNGDVFLIPASH